MIPPDEIWVKIGGEKGQGSMKMSFQLCNVPNPNSCKNSVIFSIFEASDTATNLNIALYQFRPQINSLCGKNIWRLGPTCSCKYMPTHMQHNLSSTGIKRHVCFCVPSCVPCMVYLEHLVGSKSLHAVIKHSVYVHYMYIQESTTACGVR